jgi:hypothetical protein
MTLLCWVSFMLIVTYARYRYAECRGATQIRRENEDVYKGPLVLKAVNPGGAVE